MCQDPAFGGVFFYRCSRPHSHQAAAASRIQGSGSFSRSTNTRIPVPMAVRRVCCRACGVMYRQRGISGMDGSGFLRRSHDLIDAASHGRIKGLSLPPDERGQPSGDDRSLHGESCRRGRHCCTADLVDLRDAGCGAHAIRFHLAAIEVLRRLDGMEQRHGWPGGDRHAVCRVATLVDRFTGTSESASAWG